MKTTAATVTVFVGDNEQGTSAPSAPKQHNVLCGESTTFWNEEGEQFSFCFRDMKMTFHHNPVVHLNTTMVRRGRGTDCPVCYVGTPKTNFPLNVALCRV